MKRIIFLIFLILNISFASALLRDENFTFKGVNSDSMFTKLIYTNTDIAKGEAIFEIYNPFNELNLTESFYLNSYLSKGNPINSFEYYVKKNISNEKIIYINQEYNDTCFKINNFTKLNESYTCLKSIQIQNGTQIINSIEWVKTDLINKGKYEIKIIGTWTPHLGEQSVDWYPELYFNKEVYNLPRDISFNKLEWDWWNTSFSNYRNITNVTGSISYFNISYQAAMQTDFDDVRFIDGNGNERGYFLQNKSDGAWAIFRINTTGLSLISMYYGNADVSTTSNISNVFNTSLNAGYSLDIDGRDFVGSNNGVITNAIPNSSGYLLGSYFFDGAGTGASADYIAVSSGVAGDTTMTVTGWFKTFSGAHGNIVSINNNNGGAGGTGWAVVDAYGDGTMSIGIEGVAWGKTSGTYNDGIWHFFVGTRSGSTYNLYIDGSSTPDATLTNAGGTFSNSHFIGACSSVGISCTRNGLTDDILIFSEVLTTSQMKEIYNTTAPNYVLGDEQYQAAGDTCSPSSPLSANYVYECSDYCNITSNVDAGGFNITFNGTGLINLNANITNYDEIDFGNYSTVCQLVLNNQGNIIS